jgi:peptidoglycan/LPS O-acetylase OafA/YrhL
MNKKQPKLYGLDHLRALAILLVWFFHYQGSTFAHPQWATSFNFGWTGVDLFFVLSGFLISSNLFAHIRKGKALSLREFFVKRVFRIFPIYFLVIAIYFLFPYFREKEALPPLWKFLTFVQNFGLNRSDFGTFSHAWSLCVEEHFYLFLPFALILLQVTGKFKNAWWILLTFFVIGFMVRLYCWHYLYLPSAEVKDGVDYWTMHIYYPTYNRLDGLLVGVSIAAVYQCLPKAWERISKYGTLLILVSLALLTIAYFFFTKLYTFNASIFGFPFIAIGYGFLVAGALSPSSFLFKWNSKTTTFIATLSYGIYLTHKGIIHMVQDIFPKWGIEKNGSMIVFISFFFCVLGAWLLHLAIEKPFMKWRDMVLKKRQVTNVNVIRSAVAEV